MRYEHHLSSIFFVVVTRGSVRRVECHQAKGSLRVTSDDHRRNSHVRRNKDHQTLLAKTLILVFLLPIQILEGVG
jgi:hypothetical protein